MHQGTVTRAVCAEDRPRVLLCPASRACVKELESKVGKMVRSMSGGRLLRAQLTRTMC